MTAYRLTLVARKDLEGHVRRLARDDLRSAERAVDELCATMEWLSGTPDVGQLRPDLAAGDGADGLRTWTLRDWLLVYRDPATTSLAADPAVRTSGEPVVFLRVLDAAKPGRP